MTRVPLRPLARIIHARSEGQNPDLIEQENTRHRHVTIAQDARARSESRLLVLLAFFFFAFAAVGAKMAYLASSSPQEPIATSTVAEILSQRADIIDRNGGILATNLITNALYAQPPLMIDKAGAAKGLAEIFPDLDVDKLTADFSGSRKFIWVKRKISPEQMQQVHNIGEPGLRFGPREMRLYPNGKLAAHILGGSSYGREDVRSAEVIGTAGVELAFDDYLRDPILKGEPLQLSLDLTVQAATRHILYGGMKLLNAAGATAVMMDVHTGEVVALVSLPDFDPNNRPRPAVSGDPSISPLFNRSVQGLYELGSVFKTFTAAMALEDGIAEIDTMVDTTGPIKWGKFKINDYHNYGRSLSLTDVIVKSSNLGTARLATAAGIERQKEFLGSLGLLDATPLEVIEGGRAKPLLPPNWSELSVMTISYGHGISSSPVHLATAYASLLNGGTRVKPTLLKVQGAPVIGPRIVRQDVSAKLRDILRQVVERGTASMGSVEGYSVGGKTGTADKPNPEGGYYEDKVIATFASVFPTDKPKYVLVVTFDEPVETSGLEPRRTAGWTAVPVAAEIIRRTAPLLGLRPEPEKIEVENLLLTSN
jgi:cell division protein FtsI (penicillin-binding protein 3)